MGMHTACSGNAVLPENVATHLHEHHRRTWRIMMWWPYWFVINVSTTDPVAPAVSLVSTSFHRR